jgi:integrase
MQGARLITPDEIKTMLQTENQRDRMLILVGLYFGTRISETVQLTFGDFKGKYVRIRSVKRSNDRILEIPDEFKTELERLRGYYLIKGCPVQDQTPLFLSQKKDAQGQCKAVAKEHASYIIKQMREKYGLDDRISAHSFRKSFTTKLHGLCKHNLPELANYTGHKSLDSLRAYIKTTEETSLTKELNWI